MRASSHPRYHLFDTSFGVCGIAWTHEGIVRVQLPEASVAATAARAVGGAMARNPWPVVVACHRVLTAQRASGGFSAYGSETTQRRLLLLEGVRLPSGTAPHPDLFD